MRKIVTQAMKRKRLTAYGLAKVCGLTEPAIRTYVQGDTDMRGEKLARVLAALELEIRPKK